MMFTTHRGVVNGRVEIDRVVAKLPESRIVGYGGAHVLSDLDAAFNQAIEIDAANPDPPTIAEPKAGEVTTDEEIPQ